MTAVVSRRAAAMHLSRAVDINPLRVIWSVMDGLRDRLTYVPVLPISPVPLEWLVSVAVVGVCLNSLGVAEDLDDLPAWLEHLCWILTPYVVCQLVRLVWQPVPFFIEQPVARASLPPGEYRAWCFGRFIHTTTRRSFWRRRPRSVSGRVSFGWCPGTVTLGSEAVSVRTRARTVAYRASFEGRLEHTIDVAAPQGARIRRGDATVLWQRLPAVELRTDDCTVVAVLRD